MPYLLFHRLACWLTLKRTPARIACSIQLGKLGRFSPMISPGKTSCFIGGFAFHSCGSQPIGKVNLGSAGHISQKRGMKTCEIQLVRHSCLPTSPFPLENKWMSMGQHPRTLCGSTKTRKPRPQNQLHRRNNKERRPKTRHPAFFRVPVFPGPQIRFDGWSPRSGASSAPRRWLLGALESVFGGHGPPNTMREEACGKYILWMDGILH